MKKVLMAVSGLAFLWSCMQNSAPQSGQGEFAEAKKTYAQYCSSCHGEKVEAFVDRKWQHGNDKDAIIASITNGWVENGMPAWKGTVSEEGIEGLADLIVNSLGTVNQYDFDDTEKTDTYVSEGMILKLEKVIDGVDSPWGLTSLPDGDLLITDREGDLWRVKSDQSKIKITGVPEVLAEGQGGLMDIALHPNYKENGWIYLTYAKSKGEGKDMLSTTALVRGKLEGNTLVQKEELFEALPYLPTRHHYGGRMAFDEENFLYFSVGDRGRRDDNPQSLSNGCGKIHRIYDDGRIPQDNPFVNTPNAVTSIWSYGHRNPQGLIYKADVDQIWEHEHGPRGGDEVNIIEKGKNFGWPVISYGINYDGTTFTSKTEEAGMVQPQIYYLPSIAPCGMTYVTSDKYPAWSGDILVGSLRFNYADRLVMRTNRIAEQRKELVNIGRMRNVFQAPDGYIYVGVERPGEVYRLLPQ
ncbi:PQQ-dependent sugar dehydrogenase [Jiulongibacter sp. NS-SX5]|uniref:PQQ-dependent sugar dehydrogenase n=1 Tax=Jiulongibacter sp. NS-SX5 TaxID=3463854 RepID=UPI0040580F17